MKHSILAVLLCPILLLGCSAEAFEEDDVAEVVSYVSRLKEALEEKDARTPVEEAQFAWLKRYDERIGKWGGAYCLTGQTFCGPG